ncbi:MAG TPA: S8 family serine peptidase [Gemmatimonadales bacterium]|nr:S8 family serine peptidase [Gemmatimonadales bacterium]HYT82181.1 S8 family serine peptidase [Gemmatimonadales bacterium]
MRRCLLLASLLVAAGACETPREVASPERTRALKPQAGLVDPALSTALATAAPTDQLEVIVNYDETATTRDAVTNAILSLGAGVVQFKHLALVAALATPGQVAAMASLPGIRSVSLNKQLTYLTLLHESVPTIRADAVQAMGITGKGVGIAILDSGIDGLYNPDLHYPDKTVQNVKILFNLRDVVTFSGSINKTIKQGAELFVENLPNSETSVGHGTHVAGIAAGLGAASGGYYTGVAPGAKLVGLGTGDILFIFWALAGFDYILDHQQAYNIKVVNNSWGTSGPFDPDDPINKASKTVHDHGITVVFAAGNDGPDQNTLNPYSVAPWVIGVAAGCKLVSPDPTNSAVHCADQTGQNRAALLADFSSRGIPGDPLYHPDVTAPGVHIVSDRASTGTVLNGSDANHDFDLTSSCAISAANEPYYTCASGTSMATPHVVGVVALMQEAAGGRLSPDRVLQVLTQTARPLPGFALWEVGTGYVDALAAVNAVKQR